MQIGSFWYGQSVPVTGRGDQGPKLVTTATEASGGPTRSEIVDELLLSEDAELPVMSDLSATWHLSRSLQDEVLTFSISREEHDQKLTALRARIASELRERGIEHVEDVQFTTDSAGGVVVLGGHPRQPEIEELFRNAPDLRRQVSEVSAQGSLLLAAEEAMQFQAAYREDPQQALAQFSYLFERTSAPHYTFALVPAEPEQDDTGGRAEI